MKRLEPECFSMFKEFYDGSLKNTGFQQVLYFNLQDIELR